MTRAGKCEIMGRDVTVGELMDELSQDRRYYERSGGGITLSGGECMAQPDFSEALLRACHDHGFNTAIETTAFAHRDVVARLLPHVDYFLMDIKHMDSRKHEEFTGRPNEQILENAKFIAENASDLIIRVPTVPSFNDTPDEISAIARFASSLSGVKELHLLPYHRLGQDKYTGLGRPYLMDGIEPPSQGLMADLLKVAKQAAPNLHVQIGG